MKIGNAKVAIGNGNVPFAPCATMTLFIKYIGNAIISRNAVFFTYALLSFAFLFMQKAVAIAANANICNIAESLENQCN